MPAEAALEGLNDEPVEDADALMEDTDSGPSESEASTAADDAADVAAAAEAAAAEPDVEE